MNQTQIVRANTKDLIYADWNYKEPGTEEQIEKLAKSIAVDKSAGALAVREIIKDGVQLMEVIDGNHRLQAIRFLGWEDVSVENFGEISIATAAVIARRRNHNWFDDDKLKLAKLFNDHVFKEYEISGLAEYMPESEESLEAYKKLAEFDWKEPEQKDLGGEVDGQKKVLIYISEETHNLWTKWRVRLKDCLGVEEEARAFEFAVIEALNVPEENLK